MVLDRKVLTTWPKLYNIHVKGIKSNIIYVFLKFKMSLSSFIHYYKNVIYDTSTMKVVRNLLKNIMVVVL